MKEDWCGGVYGVAVMFTEEVPCAYGVNFEEGYIECAKTIGVIDSLVDKFLV